MSHQNVELREVAESAVDALNRGDIDRFLALLDPDVEFTSMIAEAEGETFHGHEGVRRWWHNVREAFEIVQWEYLDIRAQGDRGVARVRAAGKLGGVELEQTTWQAMTMRHGRGVWWAFFRSEREAFEAVGLRE
jgi:ketosteroid isomerase-like protein